MTNSLDVITFCHCAVSLKAGWLEQFQNAIDKIKKCSPENLPSISAFESLAWDSLRSAGFDDGNIEDWASPFIERVIDFNAALVVLKPVLYSALLEESKIYATPEDFAKKALQEVGNPQFTLIAKWKS